MAYIGWIGTFEGQKGTGKEQTIESELVRELNLLGAVPIGKVRILALQETLHPIDLVKTTNRPPWFKVFG